jgi:hypothetical protein
VVILRASLPRFTRHQKQRNFPYNSFFGGGVWGGADKKWKGKFFVLVSPLKVLNKQFFHHSPIIL